MPHTKEEALRLSIKILPIKHSMKRRAIWHDYRQAATSDLVLKTKHNFRQIEEK